MRRRADAISRAASKPAPAATTLTPQASATPLKVKSCVPPRREPSSASACVDHNPVPTATAPASTQPQPSRLSRERAVFSACVNTPAVSKDTSVASNSSRGRASTSITAAWGRGQQPDANRRRLWVAPSGAPKDVTVTDATPCAQPVRGGAPPVPGVAALQCRITGCWASSV